MPWTFFKSVGDLHEHRIQEARLRDADVAAQNFHVLQDDLSHHL